MSCGQPNALTTLELTLFIVTMESPKSFAANFRLSIHCWQGYYGIHKKLVQNEDIDTSGSKLLCIDDASATKYEYYILIDLS